MSRQHEEAGKLFELDDEEMRAKGTQVTAELEEMYKRHGMQFLFSMGVMRQAREYSGDEDAEVCGSVFGCLHCIPYFFASTAMRNPHIAQILADTVRWVEKFKQNPHATLDDQLESLPVPPGKPN